MAEVKIPEDNLSGQLDGITSVTLIELERAQIRQAVGNISNEKALRCLRTLANRMAMRERQQATTQI